MDSNDTNADAESLNLIRAHKGRFGGKLANLSKLADTELLNMFGPNMKEEELVSVRITLSTREGGETSILDDLPLLTIHELCRCDWIIRIERSSHCSPC